MSEPASLSATSEAEALLSAFDPEMDPDIWRARLTRETARVGPLADAFDAIATEAREAGDLDRARAAAWSLFLLRLSLVQLAPRDPGRIADFATAADGFGHILLALGNLKPAETMLGEALAYRRGLFADFPEDLGSAQRYGLSLWRQVDLAQARADSAAEERWLQETWDHFRRCRSVWPEETGFSSGILRLEHRLREIDGIGPPPA